ncbi:DUF1517 domain-containing protein [Synechococcus elongatus]|uniref:DUF1517 domain-containing protein n=2 Tax=Synechococcus elongatus TaxID=32046 RepID=Q31PD0_SYNE7|nr:DUF1517 domain-containing protein [Synechococcus elongatus]ABB57089.1 conserved hypothetical protein [Synechococcus elongatus PCC 7942 = FACHB-805]AJD58394.1 hypothetical protein M744_11385 [Synechococcus elongatus UTEX 2973]MBD2587490.1 DUF1517 domain-containing protein [Synechococcus elongatus FACHB-242]MBD2688731.1 DUF1517 domain-containing protein [Synechococcus elongatus FACHB-1061]MBD2707802.1 DUF1517 domain-containing protein [Synechococcus elongatus PCC 7942 = FACHB-805]
MRKPFLKSIGRLLVVVLLVGSLTLSAAQSAWAARGGRIGGGSFSAPSRSFSSPSRSYSGGGGGYYRGGGGFGFPFVLPLFFGGGGGLFGFLIMIAIAGFLLRAFQNASGGEGNNARLAPVSNSQVAIAQVQVGLLAGARSLQRDLEALAMRANTNSKTGLANVLQETTLALLRHPEYWAYGSAEAQKVTWGTAENAFNRLTLMERSKFSGEGVSNVDGQVKQATHTATAIDPLSQAPAEYIVVTLLVAATTQLRLPALNSTSDLQQALRQIGAIGSESLLAVEVLWSPDSESESLTRDDVMANYPDLRVL